MSSRYFVDALVLMVILASSAICVSVYLRTKTEFEAAMVRHRSVAERVEQLKIETERKEREVHMLKSDYELIESCARQELGLIRPNDLVIKLAPEQETRAPNATRY
ncbi:MAG TPA: septum formation initiator family protein [Blastocatellia bacterium]|nr:septum formation initiator family protein [Blastocatellia bacterium]